MNQEETPDGVRQDLIHLRLRQRERDYTEFKQIKIFVGTWNVNAKIAKESLSPWIGCSKDQDEPDIYVLGFQELDTSAEAFLYYDPAKEDMWCRAIAMGLGSRAPKYRKIASKQLIGMLIVLFVKEEHVNHIRQVATDSAGCGVLGLMGNKGAVAIRFQLYDSILCFINSHLAADSSQVERRNQDYHEICRKINFARYQIQTTSANVIGATVAGASYHVASNANFTAVGSAVGLFDTDILIWMGDLNYRINMPDSTVKQLIQSKQLAQLLNHDQLLNARKSCAAFINFEEAEIKFNPTYKFDLGTDNYDTSEKRRTPSWCDRILWRKSAEIKNLSYKSHPLLRLSDHKPVSATFETKIKIFNLERQKRVLNEILKELDKLENDNRPEVKISTTHLDFEFIKVLHTVTKVLEVTNTGSTIAHIKFIPKNEDKSICQEWLVVSPQKFSLDPGSSVKISFDVRVTPETANHLSSSLSGNNLDDILVLHLYRGRDFFITVNGKCLESCFGKTLEDLAQRTEPVRSQKLIEDMPPALPTLVSSYSVPQELWRLTNFIIRYGASVPDLFQNDEDQSLVEYIINCLDTGEPFDNNKLLGFEGLSAESRGIYSMAKTLLLFLKHLPVPVIPLVNQEKMLECKGMKVEMVQEISNLPVVHRATLTYMIAFVSQLIRSQPADQQLSTKHTLVNEFAPLLFNDPGQPTMSVSNLTQAEIKKLKKKVDIFLELLENEFIGMV